jgi:hypothetical protein
MDGTLVITISNQTVPTDIYGELVITLSNQIPEPPPYGELVVTISNQASGPIIPPVVDRISDPGSYAKYKLFIGNERADI